MLNLLKKILPKDKTRAELEAIVRELLATVPAETTELTEEKAEFLPDMSEQEVLEYERTERLGWKHLKLPWQH